jgi:hypothetical protein
LPRRWASVLVKILQSIFLQVSWDWDKINSYAFWPVPQLSFQDEGFCGVNIKIRMNVRMVSNPFTLEIEGGKENERKDENKKSRDSVIGPSGKKIHA